MQTLIDGKKIGREFYTVWAPGVLRVFLCPRSGVADLTCVENHLQWCPLLHGRLRKLKIQFSSLPSISALSLICLRWHCSSWASSLTWWWYEWPLVPASPHSHSPTHVLAHTYTHTYTHSHTCIHAPTQFPKYKSNHVLQGLTPIFSSVGQSSHNNLENWSYSLYLIKSSWSWEPKIKMEALENVLKRCPNLSSQGEQSH